MEKLLQHFFLNISKKSNDIKFIHTKVGRPSNEISKFKKIISLIKYDMKNNLFKTRKNLYESLEKDYGMANILIKYMKIQDEKNIVFNNKIIQNDDISINIKIILINNNLLLDESELKDFKIETDCIKNIESTYPLTKENDPKKIKVNENLKKFVSELSIDDNDICLILEDLPQLTLKNMLKFFKANQIYIPNWDENICKILKQDSNAVILHQNLSNLLTDKQNIFNNRIAVTWFDYCGTFNGNKKLNSFPKEDIKKFFSFNFPKNNSIFGVTFCYREQGQKKWKTVEKYIKQIGNDYGFDINNIYFEIYKSVFTLFFKIIKGK